MERENRELVALGLVIKARIDSGEETVKLADIVSDAKAIMAEAGDDEEEENDAASHIRGPPAAPKKRIRPRKIIRKEIKIMKDTYYFKMEKMNNHHYRLFKTTKEELTAVIAKDHAKEDIEKLLNEGYVKEYLHSSGYCANEDVNLETKYFIRELDENDALAVTTSLNKEDIRNGDVLCECSYLYSIPWHLAHCIFDGCNQMEDGSQLYGEPMKKRFTNSYHPYAGLWILEYCIVADEEVTDLSFEKLTMHRAFPIACNEERNKSGNGNKEA